MAIAPLVCSCGAALELLDEVPDREADGGRRVMVGILECVAGHPWIDIRPVDRPRPHPWRPGQPGLPFGGIIRDRAPRPVRRRRGDRDPGREPGTRRRR